MTFSTNPALARALAARGYETATPVQSAVLEAEAAGRDLIVSAQTGSGKTIAFGMSIASTLLGSDEKLPPAGAPLALVIAPTRELAMQVQRELTWLYAETGARIVICVGGMDPRAEGRQLGFGAHIVVGTPGRIRDHLERKRLDFSNLKSVVLDEADEMLDLGFREDLEFILDATPAERQTLLFSATMPREIEALAGRYQRDALRIQTLRRNEQHADIEYQAIRVAPSDVESAVVNVLRFHEPRTTLVFCSTREAVKRLHARFVERGFSAVALSGELSQAERNQALQTVRDGRARLLVATDVAARGLDLPDLALVIHADLPNDHETLLHRSGRTGRAGKKGLCVLIVPFNRRRKAEMLLGAARLKVTWAEAPTADAIRAKDQERLLSDPMFTDAADEEDQALARVLLGAKTPDEIALALARMHRARLPAPEDVTPDAGPPKREFGRDRERDNNRFKRDRDGSSHESRPPRGQPRDDGREMVWFRLNIGRERNADPRWLLPLICRAGDVTKAEIGAIKIFDRDTRFQIAAESAEQFELNARTNGSKEGHISRVRDGDFQQRAPRPDRDRPPHAPAPVSEVPAEASSTPPAAPRNEWHERKAFSDKPFRQKPFGDKKPFGGKKQFDERKSFGDKKPFADRKPFEGSATAGKKPHRKGQRPPHGAFGNAGPRPEGAPADHRGPSKYSNKKKHRANQPGNQ